MNSGLVFDNVSISLKEQLLLQINASVAPGEALTIMGPSGSGKSTLLAYIGGFLDPVFTAKGAVYLHGQDITPLAASARRTGILFQDPLLFPHMSVGENLLFALPPSIKGKERRAQAETALNRIGLDDFFPRDTATLSGGQKARIALMRVLLSKPHALLLDEPFSKLDANRRDQIRGLVFEEARRQNLPTILVTHDEADAKAANGKTIALQ